MWWSRSTHRRVLQQAAGHEVREPAAAERSTMDHRLWEQDSPDHKCSDHSVPGAEAQGSDCHHHRVNLLFRWNAGSTWFPCCAKWANPLLRAIDLLPAQKVLP